MTAIPIRRALVSTYDKSGVVELGRALAGAGVEIVSTGSTARLLAESGIPVTQVEQVTGFPEVLDGRVKTLHPGIHGGLLADLRVASHVAQIEQHGIAPFELLVVNLYPFVETVASGASTAECIEQIDIGGPAMLRAAAKNHANVAVVTSPARYGEVRAALKAGGFTDQQRAELAAEAFAQTGAYDIAVASWLGNVVAPDPSGFPNWVGSSWERSEVLRYGENPHQRAAVYRSQFGPPGLAGARQVQGKQMSYNNYVDAEAALRAAFDHAAPAVAIIKHANPCGIAVGSDIADAYGKALATDPVSAFGGVVAANREVTARMAEAMLAVFTEVVVAPAFSPEALDLLVEKPNLRVLIAEPLEPGGIELRPISGGMLLQESDALSAAGDDPGTWTLVSGEDPGPAVRAGLAFAWRAARSVKSNAILLASDGAAVGIGMGQVNRVDAARLAVARAGERSKGAVAASDAFFPFPDGLEILLDAGVTAVVQPGGSVRDDEVIAVARARGATMYLTGARHFLH